MRLFNEHHTFAGLQRDKSPLLHQQQYLYDARNIRLTARDGDTLLETTNEKSTKDTGVTLVGKCVGHAVIGKYLVVFTHSERDYATESNKSHLEDLLEAYRKIIDSLEAGKNALVKPTEPDNKPEKELSEVDYNDLDYRNALWQYDYFKNETYKNDAGETVSRGSSTEGILKSGDGIGKQYVAMLKGLIDNWDAYTDEGTLASKEQDIMNWWSGTAKNYRNPDDGSADVGETRDLGDGIFTSKTTVSNEYNDRNDVLEDIWKDEASVNEDGEEEDGKWTQIENKYNEQKSKLEANKKEYDDLKAKWDEYNEDEAKYKNDQKAYNEAINNYDERIDANQKSYDEVKAALESGTEGKATVDVDLIYRIDLSPETPAVALLYGGELGFDNDHMLDAVTSYESEDVQKVYWVDGKNQPRMMNICKDYGDFSAYSLGADGKSLVGKSRKNYKSHVPFDFVRQMSLAERVTVTKRENADGAFPAGVLQYIATYYDRYGQETNPFYVSPLLYTSHSNRGGSPEDVCRNTFTLSFSKVDSSFEYVRLYSLLRTSINSTPTGRLVTDINILKAQTAETATSAVSANDKSIIRDKEDGIILGPDYKRLSNMGVSTAYWDKIVYTDGGYPYDGVVCKTVWYTAVDENFENVYLEDTETYYVPTADDGHYTFIYVVAYPDTQYTIFCKSSVNAKESYTGTTQDIAKAVLEEDSGYQEMRVSTGVRETTGVSISFTDDGITGSSIDPTELLYKSKSMLVAKTIAQKDNTLFLGNIKDEAMLSDEDRKSVDGLVKLTDDGITLGVKASNFEVPKSSDGAYPYFCQLNAYSKVEDAETAVPCSGFKKGNTYRLGIQFQDKYGAWSKPYRLGDMKETLSPKAEIGDNAATITMPGFSATLPSEITATLYEKGYRKARALYVAPTALDRDVLCQGIVNRVVERKSEEKNGYLQPSWIFRHNGTNKLFWSPAKAAVIEDNNTVDGQLEASVADLRSMEIQGRYATEPLALSAEYITLNSPDLELGSDFRNARFEDASYTISETATASVDNILSAVSIQTSTPTINDDAAGALPYEKSGKGGTYAGFLSDTIYEDFIVEDMQKDPFRSLKIEQSPVNWLVYMWHRDGSLNNDMQRPSGQGTQSAKLSRKVVANLRVAQNASPLNEAVKLSANVSFFDSEAKNVVKIGGKLYNGDIDTILVPDNRDGLYFTFDGEPVESANYGKLEDYGFDTDVNTSATSKNWYMTFDGNFSVSDSETDKDTANEPSGSGHVWKYDGTKVFHRIDGKWSKYVGWRYLNTSTPRTLVRMKYKSTPHIVAKRIEVAEGTENVNDSLFDNGLVIAELSTTQSVRYGGDTESAYLNNKWIPCGEPVRITSGAELAVPYRWGDCYYQQWDCLKTYPYTTDDTNQVVEIASVMVESFVNLDGRYDRNRGLADNTNVSPTNFNLVNEAYTQADNFYTYRILPDDMYGNSSYPSRVIWSSQKSALSDTDAYTGIQETSFLDLDGGKGSVNALRTWKDSLLGFQDRSVVNIQFNSRVEIPSNDGVPIEISNNYKVTGYNELMHGIGCKSPRLVLGASGGLYFIDGITGHLFRIGDGTGDVSQSCGLSVWSKGSDARMLAYDNVGKDVYVVMDDEVLCYSEILSQFVSFYDYDGVFLVESYGRDTYALQQARQGDDYSCKLWQMFAGEKYCALFGKRRQWYIDFISNGLDSSMQDADKIFGNIDYRLDLYGEDGQVTQRTFSTVEVSNDCQDTGAVSLTNTVKPKIRMADKRIGNGSAFTKFRTWRIQIPRSNDNGRRIDRIRDTWCRIRLQCDWKDDRSALKARLKDLNVQYYVW